MPIVPIVANGRKAEYSFRPCRSRSQTCYLGAVVVMGLMLGIAQNVCAQAYISIPGERNAAAPQSSELGYIEAANGGLHLEVPLGVFPQRGTNRPLSYRLMYDSTIWTDYKNSFPLGSWFPTGIAYSTGGWRLVPGVTTSQNTPINWTTDNKTCATLNNFNWTDPAGNVHFFPITTYLGSTCSGKATTGDAFATDSSGYHMYVVSSTQATVYGPDGSIAYELQTLAPGLYETSKDSNGNYLSVSGLQTDIKAIDTLGRAAVEVVTSCNSNSNLTCYSVSNSRGTPSQFTTTATYITAKTQFKQSGVTDCSTCTFQVLESIGLPDGTSYQFKYDCDSSTGNPACGSPSGQTAYYGVITSITLPTGGQVSYSYANFVDAHGASNRVLASRTSGGGTWQYAYSVIDNCSGTCEQQATVTKPSGDVTVYKFLMSNGMFPYSVQYYNGPALAANLVATLYSYWDYSVSCPLPNCKGFAYIRKTTDLVILTMPGGGTITKQTQYTYDSPQAGNLTGIKEFGFRPATGTPDRATYTTYLTTGTNNIDRPLTITVCGGSGSSTACPGGGTAASQTLFSYDSYGSGGLTSISGTSNHDDTNFGASFTARGNATSVQRLFSGSSYVTTALSYDTTGNLTQEKDAANNLTSYHYGDSFYSDNGSNPPQAYTPAVPTNSSLTSVTMPIIGVQSSSYYFGSGKEAISTDQNGAHTYFHFFDPLDRSTETDFPVSWKKTVYGSPTEADVYIGIGDSSPSTSCSSCQHKQMTLNGLGQEELRALVNSPGGAVNATTTYDSNDRVKSVSHLYIGASPSGAESITYDGLDRQVKLTHPDNTFSQTLYGPSVTSAGGASAQLCSSSTYGVGFPVLTIDETGGKRQIWVDGLGRTIEADEPDSSNNLTVNTCYAYNILDDLTLVVQGSQTRSFSYDSLGRMTQEVTPEGGTKKFSYTNSSGGFCSGDPSRICSKVAPAPNQQSPTVYVTTTYCYDALNRMTAKGYGTSVQACPLSAPALTYTYDQGGAGGFALGKLTAMTDGSGSESYTYDKGGRVLGVQKAVASKAFTFAYQYNVADEVTQITYPSGRKLSHTYDAVGKLLTVADASTTYISIPSGSGYNAAGQVVTQNYGNGVAANYTFSPLRSQLTGLSYTKSGQTLFALKYWYSVDATNCPSGTVSDNGQIECIGDSVDSGRTVTYGYDQLHRLSSATTVGSTTYPKWGVSETYDRYGNRWTQAVTAGVAPGSSLSFGSGMNGSVSNRPNGYTFDAAGNLITEPLSPPNQYTYDDENRLVTYSGNNGSATYLYDGHGLRVQKTLPGTATVYMFSGSKVLAEYDNGAVPTSPSREYIYAGGALVAKIESGATVYYHSDHRSVRFITDSNGNKLGEQGHFPYGEQWYQSGTTTKWMFTSYERDQQSKGESGLDYALARFYNSRTASFCSADPVNGNAADPQTWNRYEYAHDDPINMVDPNGTFWGFLAALFSLIFNYLVGVAAQIGTALGVLGQTQVGVATLDYTIESGFVASASSPITVVSTLTSGSITSAVLGTTLNTAAVAGYLGVGAGLGAPQIQSSPSQHFDVDKKWYRQFPCNKSADAMGKALDQNFTSWAASRVPGGQFLFQPMGPITDGATINPIVMLGTSPSNSSWVVTEVTATNVNSSGFTFVTNPAKHIFDGTVDFRITPGSVSGTVMATITVLANWAHWWQFPGRDLAMNQESTAWNHLIDRIQQECTQ